MRPALATALLASVLLVAPSRGAFAGAGTDEPAAGLPKATLGELRRERGAWVGRAVELTIQFDRRPERWNPWLTRFGTDEYLALTAWGDEQFLWLREEYEDPAPHLFARLGTRAAERLARARRHDRFRVRAVVRAAFLDEPWIEVVEAERLDESVPEGTILHASRALRLMESEAFSLATGELDRARLGRLPARARAELDRLRAVCSGR